jgi:dihydrofolate reductase
MISLVVAYSKNRVIGRNNELPWYIPNDLKHFKQLTIGKTVVMGRKTYESIVARLGKPLPKRRNIVISSNLQNSVDGIEVVPTLEAAIQLTSGDIEVLIIGGQQVFDEALKNRYVDRIYATEIDSEVEGDKFFPALDETQWRQLNKESHSQDGIDFSFVTYQRS